MLFITIIEFLISRSSRKKIKIQESHDLSNHAYVVFSVSSLSPALFLPSRLFLFEIFADNVSAELRDVGAS